ncbi:2OG-Fe(II) oxygenase [Hyphococcus sp.]|uniref:2OG-Fe(II) oxygenase n=1 Tax=Hyphococcus sp. TaxID=2038636 RepID=UPI0035C687C6
MQAPSLTELKQHAENGDARAQYMLAAQLSGAGDKQEAERWLNAAAAQGFGDALYTLATRRLDHAGLDNAAEMLARAVENGSAPAQRLLGVLYAMGLGVTRDWAKAVALVTAAAQAGVPAAMRELSMLLFAADPDDEDGAGLVAAAAPKDPIAGAVAVRRYGEGRAHADTQASRAHLELLERAQYPHAASLRALVDRVDALRSFQPSPPDWARIAKKLADEPAPSVATPEILCETPPARAFRGSFSPEECEYVIASSARLLAPSLIADPRTGASVQDPYRTSLTAILSLVDLDLALVMINRRLATLAERPPENAESLGVLYYAPGKEYRPHCDWLPQGPELDRGGQRAATALIYLNEDYLGGETHFLVPGLAFKGGAGDVLVFENLLDSGDPAPHSRHAGLAVREGVKWLGSTWFREKKYRH